MAIALTLQKYLDAKNVRYDLMRHEPTSSSMETAEVCHVSGDCIAKGVLLRDETGYALAVLPASHHIRFSALKSQLGEDVELAMRRPNYSRTAREVPSRLWESAMA
jgi:Ala-tRNA(Pro) deacylase